MAATMTGESLRWCLSTHLHMELSMKHGFSSSVLFKLHKQDVLFLGKCVSYKGICETYLESQYFKVLPEEGGTPRVYIPRVKSEV